MRSSRIILVLALVSGCGGENKSDLSGELTDEDMQRRFGTFAALCEARNDPASVTPEVKTTVEAILADLREQTERQDLGCADVEAMVAAGKDLHLSFAWHGGIRKIWPVYYFNRSLASLDVSGNQVVDFHKLNDAFVNLKYFYGSGCGIQDPSTIFGVPTLEMVNLSANEIVRLPTMDRLRNLRVFDISYNRLNSLNNVGHVPLLVLHAGYQAGADGTPSLKQRNERGRDVLRQDLVRLFSSLQMLSLDGNHLITDTDFLQDFDGLTSLSLRETNVKKIDMLKNLKNLKYLDLSYAKISDQDLQAISALPLEHLLVAGNMSIAHGQALSGITSLRSVSLAGTALSSAAALTPLSQLKVVDLWQTTALDFQPGPALQWLYQDQALTAVRPGTGQRSGPCCLAEDEPTRSRERLLNAEVDWLE